LDIFDLNIDDLGIKILGEVFLCEKCQKEIPQKDVDVVFGQLISINILNRKDLRRSVHHVLKNLTKLLNLLLGIKSNTLL